MPDLEAGFRTAAAGLLIPLAAALWLGSLPASAQEVGCGDCHGDVAVPSPVHGDLGCTDCHSGIGGYPHAEEAVARLAGGALCGDCHEAGEEVAGSVHGDLACGDCHGAAHEILPAAAAASPISPLKQFQTCGSCHDSPPELVDGYLISVHAKALLVSGLVTAPSCTTCHGAHDVRPPSDPRSAVSHGKVPETCGSCHLFILQEWEDSAHGAAWREGDESGPVCVTCHASHRVLEPRGEVARLKFPESCGGCHGEPYSTYRDSFHGQATDLGFLTAAICSDCHTPHRNLPAEHPASSVHPANLQATCGGCHGQVSAAFVSFDPHSDPADPERHRAVHRVWLFMTALLIGVFGSFGLHDLLWLQRSLVGVLRGEFAGVRARGEPYVRRFSAVQVGVHAVVVVTFLVLAATGLPLRFHSAGWAKALAGAFGGVGTTSVLHRLAAVLTFGYFLFHLAQVLDRAWCRKEPGMFWGWKSMVPRGKDFADLWRNVRYFLYLGPRPRLDRWTYWEKFDYFAVFWGVAIIGASGLVLWFPALVTRVLPGWTLNAAYVVHGDEALLAVGFIFIFHFFHTHLRPESFPFDPVIFTGSVPLERFKEERPLEYERLVVSGALESRFVEPPSTARRRAGYLFGAASLLAGLVLIAAILSSVLSP